MTKPIRSGFLDVFRPETPHTPELTGSSVLTPTALATELGLVESLIPGGTRLELVDGGSICPCRLLLGT